MVPKLTAAARRTAQLKYLVDNAVFSQAQTDDFLALQPQFLNLAFHTLHDDDNYLVLSKPWDVRLDLGNDKTRRYPEEITVADHLVQDHAFVTLRFCHQLDAATSGCLVVAKRKPAAAAASQLFAKRRVHKWYHALVFGTVDAEAHRLITAPLGPTPGSDFLQRVDDETGKRAETRLSVLRYGTLRLPGPHHNKPVTHLLLEPVTGRRHQLRVHCQHIGHPMVGDANYGGDWHSYRLFLHAHRIVLEPLPAPTARIDVTADCRDFDDALEPGDTGVCAALQCK